MRQGHRQHFSGHLFIALTEDSGMASTQLSSESNAANIAFARSSSLSFPLATDSLLVSLNHQFVHRELTSHFGGKPNERDAVTVALAQYLIETGWLIRFSRPAFVPELLVLFQHNGLSFTPLARIHLQRLARVVIACSRVRLNAQNRHFAPLRSSLSPRK